MSRHIHVKRVDIESDNSECDRNTDNSCVLQRMKHLCNEKKACVRETDGKSCMFEPMFVHIFYTCKGKTIVDFCRATNYERECKHIVG